MCENIQLIFMKKNLLLKYEQLAIYKIISILYINYKN